MTEISTIGYEGADLDDFLATLDTARIDFLVDVRELPASRRKGFSKNALADNLNNKGIKYVHLRGLGDPKPGRDAARRGDKKLFLSIYTRHFNSNAAQADLKKACELAKSARICLMCYERDPFGCHRKIVADRISAILDGTVAHLGVQPQKKRVHLGSANLANAYTG